MLTIHRQQWELSHNARVTRYPDGTGRVIIASAPIYRESGWQSDKPPRKASLKPREDASDRARRRAVSRVRDLARANCFDLFATLTLDPEKIDRYDAAVCTRKLSRWLDNQVRRRGLRYVLVPELHKNIAQPIIMRCSTTC